MPIGVGVGPVPKPRERGYLVQRNGLSKWKAMPLSPGIDFIYGAKWEHHGTVRMYVVPSSRRGNCEMDKDISESFWMSIFHVDDERIEFRSIPGMDLYVTANKSRDAHGAPDTRRPPVRSLIRDPVNRRGD